MDYNKLCLGCFEIKHTDVCPYCGFDSRSYEHGPLTLPPGSVLAGRYLVGRTLGQGGFGITYIGFDLTLEIKVAIKEFLPQGLVLRASDHATVSLISKKDESTFRSGVERFTDEARILAKLAHIPGIVKVSDYFQENATAYFVMEYVEGMNLKTFLQTQGGRIPYEQALTILRPLMEALAQVHELSLLHRDISTDNIYITSKGQTKLLDFGAARYALGDEKSLSVILKHGYAPEEQYRSRGNQGPWTDVYALSATLYTCITGALPPDSIERLSQDTLKLPSTLGVAIPPNAEKALEKALAVRAQDRMQNMNELLRALSGAGAPFAPGQTLAASFAAGGSTVAAPNAPGILAKQPGLPNLSSFKNLLRNRAALIIGGGALALVVMILLIALPKRGTQPGNGGGGGGIPVSNTIPPSVTSAPSVSPVPSEAPTGEYVSEAMRFAITLSPGWSIGETLEGDVPIAGLAKNNESHAFVMYVPGFGVEDFRADMDGVVSGILSENPDLEYTLASEEDTQVSAYDTAYYIYNINEGDTPWGLLNLYVIDCEAYGMDRACYLLGSRILVSEDMDSSIISDTVEMFFTLRLLDAGEAAPPSATPAPTPNDGKTAYTNTQVGFSVRYPNELAEVVEYPNNENSVYFLLQKGSWENYISISRLVDATVADFLASDEENLLTIYDTLRLADENEIFISSSGEYHAKFFNVTLDGALYRMVRLAGQLGDDVVIITMRGDEEHVEQMELYTDAILETLSYL